MGEEGKTEQKRGEQRTLFSMEGRRRSESERQRKRMQDSSSLSSSFVAVKISKRAAVAWPDSTWQSTGPYFPCAGSYQRKIERARRGSHSEFTNRGNGTSTRCNVATRRHAEHVERKKGRMPFGDAPPLHCTSFFPLFKYILSEGSRGRPFASPSATDLLLLAPAIYFLLFPGKAFSHLRAFAKNRARERALLKAARDGIMPVSKCLAFCD